MRLRILRVFAVAFLAAGFPLARPVVAQTVFAEPTAPPPDEYKALIDEYASGDGDRAALSLAAWPLQRLRDAAGGIPIPANRSRAAAMLHLEAALDAPRQDLAYAHVDRGRSILTIATHLAPKDEVPGLRDFSARWRAMAVIVYAVFGDIGRAQFEVTTLLSDAANDRNAQLLRGILVEMQARQIEPNLRGRSRYGTDGGAYSPSLTYQAQQAYEQVVKEHPDFLEARIRLGWVMLLRHATSVRVEEQLKEVAAHTDRPDLLYLAHLFLGAVEESADHLDAAAREFAAAHAVLPRQTSFLALMQIDRARGQEAEAAALANALAGNEAQAADDPWRRYNAGVTSGALMDSLRKDARTR